MEQAVETVYLASGCFWGAEELLRKLPGVLQTRVGYMGGSTPHATYEIVRMGHTYHAETVRIEFDPAVLNYQDLLFYFFKIHDPTTLNQQGNDKGTQYRSAVFYTTERQREVAKEVIEKVNASGVWPSSVVTKVEEAKEFWDAEEFHQSYLQKNPGGYTCHFERRVKFT